MGTRRKQKHDQLLTFLFYEQKFRERNRTEARLQRKGDAVDNGYGWGVLCLRLRELFR